MNLVYEILQVLAALACVAEFLIQRWRDYKRSTDEAGEKEKPGGHRA